MARLIDNIPERPPNRDIRQLARVLRFLWPYRARMAVAGIALVVAAGCVLVLGQGLKRVVDAGFSGSDPASLDTALFALLAIVCVLALATYTRFYSVSWIGERVSADIRRAVFGHLLEQSPGFFETIRTGEAISRLTNDTALLEVVIGSSASFALRNTLIMLGALVMLVITSPKLTALVVLGVPLVIAPILLFGRRVRKLSRASQDRVADVSAYIDEALHEIRTVQSYVHEDRDRERFAERVEQAFRAPASPQALPDPPRGEVRFERVTFHYPSRPDTAALSDFSLSVSRGEKVALVGPSGAGKSTVFQLLLRYYDPDGGAITL